MSRDTEPLFSATVQVPISHRFQKGPIDGMANQFELVEMIARSYDEDAVVGGGTFIGSDLYDVEIILYKSQMDEFVLRMAKSHLPVSEHGIFEEE